MNKPSLMESLATVNSLIRTLLALAVVGAASLGSWWVYSMYNSRELAIAKMNHLVANQAEQLEQQQQELENQARQIKDLTAENQRLDTALRLIKVDRRVARLTVLDQVRDPEQNVVVSKVEFAELDPEGRPLDEPRVFDILGDEVFIHSWVVKFDDKYVEQADLHRSTSLVLFQRIFGDEQTPSSGFPLDRIGERPRAYGGGQASDFEQRIWGDFWQIANNPERAAEMGIRAIHGEAPSMKVQKGKTYKIQLRASGGIWIPPGEDAQPDKPAT